LINKYTSAVAAAEAVRKKENTVAAETKRKAVALAQVAAAEERAWQDSETATAQEIADAAAVAGRYSQQSARY